MDNSTESFHSSEKETLLALGRKVYEEAVVLGRKGEFKDAALRYAHLSEIKSALPEGDSARKEPFLNVYSEKEPSGKHNSKSIESVTEQIKNRVHEINNELKEGKQYSPEELESLRRMGMYQREMHLETLPEFKIALESSGLAPETIREIISHENAHASRAEVLGCEIKYGLGFVRYENGIGSTPFVSYTFPPFLSEEEQNKVGHAIATAPDTLSEQDAEQAGVSLSDDREMKFSNSDNTPDALSVRGEGEVVYQSGFDPSQFDIPPFEPTPLPELTEEEKKKNEEYWEKRGKEWSVFHRERERYVEDLSAKRKNLRDAYNNQREFLGEVYRRGIQDEEMGKAKEVLQILEGLLSQYADIQRDLHRIIKEREETKFEDEQYEFKDAWYKALVDESRIYSDVNQEIAQVEYQRGVLKRAINSKLDPQKPPDILES